jgi:hypothetical protein
MDCNSYGKERLYQGVLIPCQSYQGDYAYPGGRVAMSDVDGIDFSTQVPSVRCTRVPVAVPCRARHLMPLLPETRFPWCLSDSESPRASPGSPGMS